MPRWLLTIVIIITLFALDRAYVDGKNAAFVMSGVRRAADVVTEWASALVRKVRP